MPKFVFFGILFRVWRRTQVVRDRSAKPSFISSILIGAFFHFLVFFHNGNLRKEVPLLFYSSFSRFLASTFYLIKLAIRAGTVINVPIELPSEERIKTRRTFVILFLYQPENVPASFVRFSISLT